MTAVNREPAPPSYQLHNASGRAITRVGGRTFYLGVHGSPESRENFERLLAEWRARTRFLPPAAQRAAAAQVLAESAAARANTAAALAGAVADGPLALKVDDLIAGFWRHAEEYYRKDGLPTGELSCLRSALTVLHDLYGSRPAASFGPLALKACRELLVGRGLSRTTINGYVARIRQCFRWGVENELVPASVHEALRAVAGLKRGRSAAREPEPVRPVAEAEMRAVLPHVAPAVAAMILLQWWTGMRPQEVVAMRGGDLDRGGSVWLYRPRRHKLEHQGLARTIPIGPQAQEVLGPWLRLDPEAPLFSPKSAEEGRNRDRRQLRRLPRWPSHDPARRRSRRQAPRRRLKETYGVDSYRRAVARACEVAGVATWSPNQLRHAAATRLRRQAGLDVAQAVLGHQLLETTQVYAEVSQAKAIEAMARYG